MIMDVLELSIVFFLNDIFIMIVIHMISRFFSMENPIFQAPEGQGGPVSPVAPVSTATLMATLPGASEGAWPAPPTAPGPSPASDVAVGMVFCCVDQGSPRKTSKISIFFDFEWILLKIG